jgi:cytosine deaminase
MIDTLLYNARLPDGGEASIAVKDGSIAAIGAMETDAPARETVDVGGALAVPGFVDGHLHLDFSFHGDAWKPHKPCTAGFDVRERVAFQKENMAAAAPMAERARNQIELCLSHGTTHMRSHVMVDASVGLTSLETILAVREEYRDCVDIEIVAFPQSGLLTSPGTAGLLDTAMGLGADLVGGLDPASVDRDVKGQLDVVFGLAEKHGAGVDIHLHDLGTLGIFEMEEIAAYTRARSMQGRVTISHALALGEAAGDTVARTAHCLARAGVSVLTNAPSNWPFPPVAALRAAGVVVFAGNDNIRDSWWPYGNGDMLARAMMIGYRSGFYTDEELAVAFDLATTAGATALGLPDYGLRVGCKADFVVLDAAHIPEAVVAMPPNRMVYKDGRRIVADGRLTVRPS